MGCDVARPGDTSLRACSAAALLKTPASPQMDAPTPCCCTCYCSPDGYAHPCWAGCCCCAHLGQLHDLEVHAPEGVVPDARGCAGEGSRERGRLVHGGVRHKVCSAAGRGHPAWQQQAAPPSQHPQQRRHALDASTIIRDLLTKLQNGAEHMPTRKGEFACSIVLLFECHPHLPLETLQRLWVGVPAGAQGGWGHMGWGYVGCMGGCTGEVGGVGLSGVHD